MSLRRQWLLAFALFIIVPFTIMGWFSFNQATGVIRDEVGDTMHELVQQNHVTLQRTLSAVNDNTLQFMSENFFNNSDYIHGRIQFGDFTVYTELDTSLRNYSFGGAKFSLFIPNPNLTSAETESMEYQTRGFFYFNREEYLPGWFDETMAIKAGGRIRVIEELGINNGKRKTVAYLRSINAGSNGAPIGVLAVTQLETLFYNDINSIDLPEDGQIFVLNEEGRIIAATGSAELGEKFAYPSELMDKGVVLSVEDGREYMYAFSESRKWDRTKLIYKLPVDSITGSYTSLQSVILVSAVVYLFMILVFTAFMLRSFLKPLVKLVSFTSLYEPGVNMKPVPVLDRKDELGQLFAAFKRMTIRLDQLIQEKYMLGMKQREMELITLHSQITPHLLYNTLDSIYWSAVDKEELDIANMVRDLSMLLRIGLSRGQTQIRFSEEMEHATAYVRLQRERYENAFQVHWNIDQESLSCIVPKVMIQPLIENSILHGVGKMDEEGEIWVRSYREEDALIVEIADNGFQAVDWQVIEDILQERGDPEKGYGIRNVNRRIRLHYGSMYGLSYSAREGGGTVVKVTLPFHGLPDT